MTEADFAAWAEQWGQQRQQNAPAPIVPVPAATVLASGAGLRGSRVLIGLPGHGWRDGMRADAAVRQGSRTLVPVLAEAEWYRAERERIEVFVPLVPVDRVWVETIQSGASGEGISTVDAGLHVGGPATPTAPGSVASLDAPPTRVPLSAKGAGQLTGRRLVHVGSDGEQRGLRAVTEAHLGSDGSAQVRVAQEADWYHWAASGQAPVTRGISLAELWLE